MTTSLWEFLPHRVITRGKCEGERGSEFECDIFLGIATVAVLVSYYTTLFVDADNSIQSLLLTVMLIGLILQQIRLKKKLNKVICYQSSQY